VPRALGTAVAGALTDAGVGRGDRLVVAVSGGVDSMVLLDVLVRLASRLDLRLHVAHIHHGLRGASADRDAALVSTEAARCALPVSVERLAPETRTRGTSVQAWARAVRYARLEAIRRRVRAAWVLTAHNRDDQAETVLLNLLRGAGPRGLAGIPTVRERILRPFLAVSRAEIESYAAARSVRFREDPSNRSAAYRRNRIRRQLLPMLTREYNPRVVEALAALATQAREDDDALTSEATALGAAALRARGPAVEVSVRALSTAPPAVARRLFQEAFRRAAVGKHGLTRRHLAALTLLAARGGDVLLPGGLRAWASARSVWIGPGARTTAHRPAPDARPACRGARPALRLPPGRWVAWDPGGCSVRVRRVTGGDIRLSRRDPCREILHAKVLDEPLRLRAWHAGDRFRPLGLRGRKKLQDFFVDAKIPREARARVPLLVAGDRIAWVVGHRIADEFRWTGERAACVAEVRFTEGRNGIPAGSDAAVRR
jgi:tRNA(Ile)-lysidine synthase